MSRIEDIGPPSGGFPPRNPGRRRWSWSASLPRFFCPHAG